MRLFYAGEELAREELGVDVVEQFLPTGQQQVQVFNPLRAEWAKPIARGNRLHTFQFMLHLTPGESSGAALQRLTTFFTGLPSSGALVWIEDGLVTTCELVVLQAFQPSYRRGCAAGLQLGFVGGKTLITTNLILTEDDDFIMTEDGALFEMES